MTQNTLL